MNLGERVEIQDSTVVVGCDTGRVVAKFSRAQEAEAFCRMNDAAIESASTPWTIIDVLKKLKAAAEILLHELNYDSHGYEQIQACIDAAEKHIGSRPEYSDHPR